MTGDKKTSRVDVWLSPQEKLFLELLAERDKRKLSEYIRVVLAEHIAVVADKQQASE